jgi:hypothetical protein
VRIAELRARAHAEEAAAEELAETGAGPAKAQPLLLSFRADERKLYENS